MSDRGTDAGPAVTGRTGGSLALRQIDALYAYHFWANRQLYDVTTARGAEVADRPLGPHFSFPTLKGMFAHVYGADAIWLSRWKGVSLPRLPGGEDFASLAALREPWDALEREQREFLAALTDAGLERIVDHRSAAGQARRLPLWSLLHHVVNHATHHRSEIATMLTLAGGSPPDTGISTYQLRMTGQS